MRRSIGSDILDAPAIDLDNVYYSRVVVLDPAGFRND
jgi:hypothetical protein